MIVIKLCEGCGFVVGMWMIFKGIRWVLWLIIDILVFTTPIIIIYNYEYYDDMTLKL